MFFDEVHIELEGGRGGNGFVGFYRAKYVPYGAPDGGDGGNGGSVYLLADTNHNTLRHFTGKKHFRAENGKDGHRDNRAGHNGEDLIIPVPVGTLVFEENSKKALFDLDEPGKKVLLAQGGRGGYGNAHFVSSTRQAPKFAELGDLGQKKALRLELQLVADVGLLGFPSAGKSTLISHISEARPKIAEYPFTTLIPNLGVVSMAQFSGSDSQTFIVADMPGIIEGAAEGKGLGSTFLKHISRAPILLYILDPFSYSHQSMEEQFEILRKELKQYDSSLLDKPYLVVVNKIDAMPDEDRKELQAHFLKKFPKEKSRLRMISGVSGLNLKELMFELWNLIQENRKKLSQTKETPLEEIPEYKPFRLVDPQSFEVELMYEVDLMHFEAPINGQVVEDHLMPKRKLFKVTGERIEQISRMTNCDQSDAILRIYDVLKKMHVQNELIRKGAKLGDLIKIGPHIYEFHDL